MKFMAPLAFFVICNGLLHGSSRRYEIRASTHLQTAKNTVEEEYTNKLTSVLGKFLDTNKQVSSKDSITLEKINWAAKKRTGLSLEKLSMEIRKGIDSREWFVTGLVIPELFSDEFSFKDPDVKLKGIKAYAEGVNKLFDQATSRAEIIEVNITDKINRVITVTWRLEGKVRVGPGISIKPYIVYTDFKVDQKGLIYFQEDRFSIPGYDIILSAFFPFLRPFLAPPAPSVIELRKNLKI